MGLFGEVNEEMSATLYQGLVDAGYQGMPVTILLHTYGGDVYAALAMYDLMKAFPYHLTTVAVGPVMSAGSLILQGGQTRIATPNAQIMVHYGQEVSESHADARQNQRLTKRIKDIMFENCKTTRQTINSWFRVDRYMSAEEALKSGVIDAIQYPVDRGS